MNGRNKLRPEFTLRHELQRLTIDRQYSPDRQLSVQRHQERLAMIIRSQLAELGVMASYGHHVKTEPAEGLDDIRPGQRPRRRSR